MFESMLIDNHDNFFINIVYDILKFILFTPMRHWWNLNKSSWVLFFTAVRYLKFVLKNASCDITYFVMWLSIELYNIKGIRCTLGVVILRSNFMNTCLQNKAETICALHMLMKLFLFLLRILYSRTCDCVEIFTLYFTFCFVFRNTLIKKFCSRTI